MSKCQAKKFLAGGRCGGTSGGTPKQDTQGVQTSFSQLLAQREAMDTKLWSAAPIATLTEVQKTTTTLVLAEKQLNKQKQKEADIQCLLEGDY